MTEKIADKDIIEMTERRGQIIQEIALKEVQRRRYDYRPNVLMQLLNASMYTLFWFGVGALTIIMVVSLTSETTENNSSELTTMGIVAVCFLVIGVAQIIIRINTQLKVEAMERSAKANMIEILKKELGTIDDELDISHSRTINDIHIAIAKLEIEISNKRK